MPTSPKRKGVKPPERSGGGKKSEATTDSVGRERGLLSLGCVGVKLWRATKIYLCIRRPSCHQGGGMPERLARACGVLKFDQLTDWLVNWSNAGSSPAPRLPKPYHKWQTP